MSTEVKPKLLFIDSGDGNKTFLYDLVKDREIEFYFATPQYQPWMEEYTKKEHIIVCDVYSTTEVMSSIERYVGDHNITFDGIGTYYDFFVVQAAELAEKYSCTNISVEAAQRSSANKHLMRTKCVEKGVEMPHFSLAKVTNAEKLLEAIESFGYPLVVKPIIGSKSYGVKLFKESASLEELEEIFHNTDSETKDLFKNFSGEFLLEEFMTGPVLSVDGIVQDGIISFAGIIEFEMGPEPNFTQQANYIPARIEDTDSEACIKYAEAVIRALDFDNCGFHCELRLTDDGPRLIEIACRLPGGPLQLGYKQAYGYNLANNLVDIWLGISTSLDQASDKYILQRAVYDYSEGSLTELNGLDSLSSEPAVWAHAQITQVGEKNKTYPEVPEALYFYALEADSHDTITELENKISQEITHKIS